MAEFVLLQGSHSIARFAAVHANVDDLDHTLITARFYTCVELDFHIRLVGGSLKKKLVSPL